MYICVCKAVTENDIAAAVGNGVRTMRELRLATQCSSQCGRCGELAKTTLKEAIATRDRDNALVFHVALTAV